MVRARWTLCVLLAVAGTVWGQSNKEATQEKPAPETQDAQPATSKGAIFFDKQQTEAGFAKNAVLYKFAADHNYQVTAGRRDKPGEVEVHETDTDIMYVLDGSFTMVTGGTLAGARNTGPNEIRAASVVGGESRQLSKGDLIIIPKGTPHWAQKVDTPATYLVVKVRDSK